MFRPSHSERFFQWITAHPWPVIGAGLLIIVTLGSFLPRISKDTSADAFIDPDSPALRHRARVEEQFGLKDPIVAAVIDEDADGIFDPASLALVDWLTGRIRRLPNVDPERVTSLATEKHIHGTREGIIVEEFFARDPAHFQAPLDSPARAAEIRAAIDDFPLYQGSLVARDGSATLIVAELLDDTASEATYRAILALVDEAPIPGGAVVHVAGEGAVSGYLQSYIDRDARRLNPVAGLLITAVLALTFMSLRGALLPNLVVAATVGITFGAMGLLGVDFYVITNGLVVNLIGIAVADAIHIFSQYYEEQARRPDADPREWVVRAMVAMIRPITLTTITTIAGFTALALASVMPPIRYFGAFGALGVFIAWVYSVTWLPALMTVWPGGRLPRPFRARTRSRGFMDRLGSLILARPRAVLALSAGIVVVSVAGLGGVVADDARIENFQRGEPLYRADKAINAAMDGTYNLDILVETHEPHGLHDPAFLRRMEALQDFLVTLPGVNGTTSIVDYVKQLHQAVNENDPAAYRIPDDPLLIAQLFFLYNASADPTDFEEEVDSRYTRALVRANVDRGDYRNNRVIVPAVARYLADTFDTEGLSGTVTGRVNVDYHWIDGVTRSNLWSVLLSFAAVTLTAMAVFRSPLGGLIAVLPVGGAVLMVYAVMGYAGIALGVGTSMFAAIAIGLGVDFAIHTLDRIRELVHAHGLSRNALLPLFPTTGRALLANFVALALGFGVLATSDVPPLVNFGALVAVAVTTAFLAAMGVVPALALVLRPRFLSPLNPQPETHDMRTQPANTLGILALLGTGLLAIASTPLHAQPISEMSGREIMERVDARDDGEQVTRRLAFHKTDRGGTTIVEEGLSYRKYFDDEKRTVLFYDEPTTIRGTGFLTFDYPDPDIDDDQWLYLPALRKIRRISASDRGGYFLGTDFSYEEIKKEQKVELADYRFEAGAMETVDGHPIRVVEATPVNGEIAAELGYSRVVYRVDPAIWMSRRTDFHDLNGNHLKTIHLHEVRVIDGIVTAVDFTADNHKTGHSTRLVVSEVDYASPVADRVFSQNRLRRGL